MPLINRTQYPNGGFPFFDGGLNKRYDGMSNDFGGRVREIIRDRRANPRIYPPTHSPHFEYDLVAIELENYVCGKLNNNPLFCQSGEPPKTKPSRNFVAAKSDVPCPKCGSWNLEPRFCTSCGGNRITGFDCRDCSFRF